jgi:hypothetical protein
VDPPIDSIGDFERPGGLVDVVDDFDGAELR